MHSLINWISSLPPAVLIILAPFIALASALIVAVITLGGLRMQIRNENRRLEKRLEHERDEKRVERTMDMKREAFMTVCEGLTLGSQFLSKFADQEISQEKHQQLVSQIAPRLNRVHLIANDSTIQALVKAYDFFVNSVVELESLRVPLRMRRFDREATDKALAEQQQLEQEILAKLAELGEGTTNVTLQKFLTDRLNSIRTDISGLQTRSKDLSGMIFQMQMDVTSKSTGAALEFENYSTKAILSMRAELGFPIDAEQYETLLRGSRAKMKALVDKFIAELPSKVGFQPSQPE